MRPALILDRDGVINEDIDFLHRIEDCRFMPGIFDLARTFKAQGFALVIATNQSGIGRGLFTEAQFQTLMDWMKARFREEGAALDAVYHCPDHPTEGIGPYRRETPWRKPQPGMFLQAASDLALDLSRSWTIGDKPRDIEAGRAAGVGTLVLFDPSAPLARREGDLWIVPSLAQVAGLLKKRPG